MAGFAIINVCFSHSSGIVCMYFFIWLPWPQFCISSLLLYFPFFCLVKNLVNLVFTLSRFDIFNSLPVVFAYFCLQTFFLTLCGSTSWRRISLFVCKNRFTSVKNPYPSKLEICVCFGKRRRPNRFLDDCFVGWPIRLISCIAKNSSCLLFNFLRRGMHL